jgi:hypothetical protein
MVAIRCPVSALTSALVRRGFGYQSRSWRHSLKLNPSERARWMKRSTWTSVSA